MPNPTQTSIKALRERVQGQRDLIPVLQRKLNMVNAPSYSMSLEELLGDERSADLNSMEANLVAIAAEQSGYINMLFEAIRLLR